MSHTEKTIDSTRIFEGKVVRLRRDTVELENGKQTFREVIDHPGGVVFHSIPSFIYPDLR